MLFVLLAALFPSRFALATASEDLRLAYDLRFVDRQQSLVLLNEVNSAELAGDERIRLGYLKAYHQAFQGQLPIALNDLKSLASPKSDPELKLAINSTLLSITLGVKNWTEAFTVVKQLQVIINNQAALLPGESVSNARYAIANLYYQTGQYRSAVEYAGNLLNSELSDANKCRIFTIYLSSYLSLGDMTKASELADRFTHICKLKEMSIYANMVASDMTKVSWALSPTRATLEKNLALEARLIVSGYKPILDTYRANMAEMALELDEQVLALEFALKIIGDGEDKGYIKPLITAYRVAAAVMFDRKDYKLAYEYQSRFVELNSTNYDEEVATQLAIQQAKFNVQSKQTEIELLDGENKLLQTQSALASEQAQTTLLALALSLLLLAALVLWSWRAQKVQQHLKALSQTDELTGALNRRHFTQLASEYLSKDKQKKQCAALVLFDLDHFKAINDSYGHQVGDWVLKAVTREIEATIQPHHILGRMGGEEFAALLHQDNAESAMEIAESCRQALELIDTQATQHKFKVTASFGICDTAQVGYSFDNLTSAADLALYQAKNRGRNKVMHYSNTMKL